jgi:hypothetical protein
VGVSGRSSETRGEDRLKRGFRQDRRGLINEEYAGAQDGADEQREQDEEEKTVAVDVSRDQRDPLEDREVVAGDRGTATIAGTIGDGGPSPAASPKFTELPAPPKLPPPGARLVAAFADPPEKSSEPSGRRIPASNEEVPRRRAPETRAM